MYGAAGPTLLIAALARSRRRLDPHRAHRAAELVRSGDIRGAIALVLPWYDAGYRHGTSACERPVLGTVEFGASAEEAARVAQ